MSLPDSFYRAESAYLDPPEASPAEEEWNDAQADKADLITEARAALDGGLPARYEVYSIKTLEDAVTTLRKPLETLEDVQGRYYELEHEYPADGTLDEDGGDEW